MPASPYNEIYWIYEVREMVPKIRLASFIFGPLLFKSVTPDRNNLKTSDGQGPPDVSQGEGCNVYAFAAIN